MNPTVWRSVQQWPARAIHDTVAAIMRNPEYRRTLRESVLERVMGAIDRAIESLLRALGGAPGARRVAAVLAIGIVLLAVARIVWAERLRESEAGRRIAGARRPAAGRDPLIQAQQLAAAARYEEAAHALYRALLETLAARDRLPLHPSRTSGEYGRELRRRGSPHFPAFQRFTRRYERTLFGDRPCGAAEYDALWSDAQPLLRMQPAA